MEDYNCKRMAAMDDSTNAAVSKRRKVTASTPPLPPTQTMLQLLNSPDSCSTFCSDHSPPPSSCCSSNELSDVPAAVRSSPLLDLESKSFKTVFSNSTSFVNNKFSRETTPSSELRLDSDEMSSPVSHRRRIPERKSPPFEEIEEFFAVAEKYEHKRFAEKYNYDIVKDVPLDGRYQWVRLKP
ncbi:cyclin-dependent kinase inhibitor 7 isoform X1 [Pyrus x bretschneideri]|uniref:cyclin-dependent kinase inhibitor 7 isoform X1 n=1 Tax=Pyrus x bretschneideri TaxID=225117 RepID=UPI000511B782|nr:cyclin-dependent kinase inhibitor 7 isoform X1 [Pyrus x bretschneideri]